MQAAQGIDFSTIAERVELYTPATQQFQSALSSAAGVTGIPTFAEYEAYLTVAALTQGLSSAGADPTSASFSSAPRNVNDFNAFGLFGDHKIDFSQYGSLAGGLGPDNCFWAVKLAGQKFSPITDAVPVCGTVIPGKKAQTGK